MKKIDSVVLKETAFIAIISFIMSAFMQAIFLIVSYWLPEAWDWRVLVGNLIGLASCVLNFFLMALTVQRALDKEPKDAKNYMRLSQMLRTLMLFVIALGAYLIDLFAFDNSVSFILAVVIPYIFPRIAVMLRPLASKIKQRRNKGDEQK
ncbi:MAG: ATP synthase subunit I [Clostridia bacterium]|nr:ATP synthase subunit I [Clostridia bacterium]